jgi:hypothetical protein
VVQSNPPPALAEVSAGTVFDAVLGSIFRRR